MSTFNAFQTDFERPLMLTSEQKTIVHSTQASAIIAALAGTGKTTTLACRAVQVLRTRPEARILVLAYSRSGVQAFQHRLQMLVSTLPGNLHITTLERWCARQLRQRDAGVQFVTDPVELRAQVQQALEWLQEQLQREPGERVELPSEVDMQAFWAFNRAAKKSLLLEQLREASGSLADFCDEHLLNYTMARLFLAYERLRLDHCGDVRYYAEGDCTYALACDAYGTLLADYDLVLFDEMHDLDLASLRVLRQLLTTSQAHFLGAGDFNQHIESQAWSVFQDKLHQLADFLPQATCSLPLTYSRRFGPQIADVVNQWFHVNMKAASTRRSQVTQASYDSDAQCIQQLLQAQTLILDASTDTRPPLTVILRNPHDAIAIEWAAHQAGRSVSLHGLQAFYLHREIALLLGLLFAHGMQAPEWKNRPCPLPADVLQVFIDAALYFGKGQLACQQNDADRQTMAAQMHANPQAIWRFLIGSTSLQGGQRNFAAFGSFLALPLGLQNDVAELLAQADLDGLFFATPMSPEQKESLKIRLRIFRHIVKGLSVAQLLEHVSKIHKRSLITAHRHQGFNFQLLSIEQAKGQEFEYVALPFLEPGRFPATTPKELAFLERNRLYVAMTRAKFRLWLLCSTQRPPQPFPPY